MDGLQKTLNYLILDKKKDRYDIYSRLLERQFAAKEEQESILKEKLLSLFNHSFANVPYYKELLEKIGADKTGWADNPVAFIRNIPILTRSDIHTHSKALHSSDYRKRNPYMNASGGSSGTPVKITQDAYFFENAMAHQLLANHWHGMEPFDSIVKIWGAERDTYIGKKPFLSHVKDFFRNRYVINTFSLSDEKIIKIIDILNKKRPKLILAYVNSIYHIARFARENNLKVYPQNAIHCGAGNLYDFMRQEIASVFQCPVYNHYGTREMSSIASECSERNGLHMFWENVYTEIVDMEGNVCPPGQEGRIVVTSLNNFSMPLIRYDIGDIGIQETEENCRCGCTYPKLKKVVGRSTELIKTRSGKIIFPEFFIHMIGVSCNDGSIRSFQVRQKDFEMIEIAIVRNPGFNPAILKEIEFNIKKVMGEKTQIQFSYTETIPKTSTGKYNYVISELD